MAQRNYYNFNFQGADGVPLDTRVIKPGDALITECAYSNPSDSRIIFGERTQDEMYGTDLKC